MKVILAILFVFGVVRVSNAQLPPTIQWQHAFGGSASDDLYSIKQTSEGGYILAGFSSSGVSGTKTVTNSGVSDYWIIRLNTNGDEVWEKSFGGTDAEQLFDIQQISDGGFILGGNSLSLVSGNKTSPNYGSSDYWLIRVDASGNKIWENSYGGSSIELLWKVAQLTNGNIVLSGSSYSGASGNKTSINFGNSDIWIVCVDTNGNKLWEKAFGGTGSDDPNALIATKDGGFIVGAQSTSGISGNKTNINYGSYDFWILRFDSNGNKIWDKVFGGTDSDYPADIQQTSDEGFLVAGTSRSSISGNKTNASFGGYDIWLVRLDSSGNLIWQKSFGGSVDEESDTVRQTSDGGFIIAGNSGSGISGNKTSANFGQKDYWLVRLNSDCEKVWDNSYGGSGLDFSLGACQSTDGGYVIAGRSASGDSGNKTNASLGSDDYWVVKISPEQPIITASRTGTNIVLSWPNWKLGFQLEEAGSAVGSSWLASAAMPITNGNTVQVSIPATNKNKLFRLAK